MEANHFAAYGLSGLVALELLKIVQTSVRGYIAARKARAEKSAGTPAANDKLRLELGEDRFREKILEVMHMQTGILQSVSHNVIETRSDVHEVLDKLDDKFAN